MGKTEIVQASRTVVHQPPVWYGALPQKNNVIVGYGEGENRQLAKAQALQDIAAQLSVLVEGTTSRYVKDVDGRISRSGTQSITLKTRQNLNNARVLKALRLGDGYTYIAYQLGLQGLEAQIADALLTSWGGISPKRLVFNGVSWISDTPFTRKLAQFLVKDTGSGVQHVNISLNRKHNAWVLSVNTISRIIDQSELKHIVAWRETISPEFRLALLKFDADRGRNRLKQGDRFALELVSSDTNGYYTLFNIYPDGQLVTIKDSSKLALTQVFPDAIQQKQGMILVAETLEKDTVSEDVLLAVKSDRPLDTTMFRQVSSRKEARGHHLHTLLSWLESNNIKTVSVLRVEIQP